MSHRYENLVIELENLLDEAKRCEFSDFAGSKYAFPKMELVARLENLAERVKNGDYDD